MIKKVDFVFVMSNNSKEEIEENEKIIVSKDE